MWTFAWKTHWNNRARKYNRGIARIASVEERGQDFIDFEGELVSISLQIDAGTIIEFRMLIIDISPFSNRRWNIVRPTEGVESLSD